MRNVVETLRERGLFEDCTSPDLVKFVESPTAVYAGFDPTSSSLQVGNFVTIMGLAHFQRCGHKVVALAGGATGMIGDPSGKASERKLLTPEQVQQNLDGVRENLSRFLDFESKTAPAKIVNNNDWMQRFTFVDFLRDVGKHFRMGAMLGKESVRARMDSENGMSYCEFSYQLIQAYDFLHLHDAEGCRIQIGGSDQWGNITAGVDLIRKLKGSEAFGLTFPIICDSSGQKFGKSEGNAIYLDANRTSYYDFYQFFIRTEDADVIRFLKIFTFLPIAEIESIAVEMQAAPEKRLAQKTLAEAMTCTVHGPQGLIVAQRASEVLFGGGMEGLKADDLIKIFAHVASTGMTADQLREALVIDVVAAAGLCKSKGEVRRLMAEGGLYVNNVRMADITARITGDMLIDGRVLVLRSGKKNFHLVKVV
jgi:tyrosyl-tRNA synthetase